MLFADRADAGRRLAQALRHYAHSDARVLALPRGGVPVGYEVAAQLGLPLDVFVVRKIGVPGHEELAMGAIASGGVRVLNEETIAQLGIGQADIVEVTARERAELERREAAYRGEGVRSHDVAGRAAIVVDDGVATGASMYAVILALRAREPRRIVVAVPVAPPETRILLQQYADEVVCVATPEPFRGVGAWYSDFRQTEDDDVRALLQAAAAREIDNAGA